MTSCLNVGNTGVGGKMPFLTGACISSVQLKSWPSRSVVFSLGYAKTSYGTS
jgi:hypothetical protein